MSNVFFNGTCAVDVVNDQARGAYSGKSKFELEGDYGPLQVIPLAEATRLMEKRACTDAVEIDEGAWMEGLEVLPPLKWYRGGNDESFRCCEATSGSVHASYVRLGHRYFVMSQPLSSTHEELVCLAAKALVSTPSRRSLNA